MSRRDLSNRDVTDPACSSNCTTLGLRSTTITLSLLHHRSPCTMRVATLENAPDFQPPVSELIPIRYLLFLGILCPAIKLLAAVFMRFIPLTTLSICCIRSSQHRRSRVKLCHNFLCPSDSHPVRGSKPDRQDH